MPLTIRENLTDSTILGVWKITETSGSLLGMITLSKDEEVYFGSLRSEIRRTQWLSYRLAVRQLILPESIRVIYDHYGKPRFESRPWHLSVSHSGNYAAVIIGKVNAVGIDIEKLKPRVERVADKFLSEEEMNAIGMDHRLEKLYVHWGAKESLFKLHGKPEIDFRRNIYVKPFDYLCSGIGKCMAILRLGEISKEFFVFYRELEDYLLVYTTEAEHDLR
jgi:4'-phosphopantetheinyl transferase